MHSKRLEIARLSHSLFVAPSENIQGTPHNFPSFPLTTERSTATVGVSRREDR